MLHFRDLGASFLSFGCFVFKIWVLHALVFVFKCFIFETTRMNYLFLYQDYISANYRFLALPFVYYIGITVTDIICAELHHFGNGTNKRKAPCNLKDLGIGIFRY